MPNIPSTYGHSGATMPQTSLAIAVSSEDYTMAWFPAYQHERRRWAYSSFTPDVTCILQYGLATFNSQ